MRKMLDELKNLNNEEDIEIPGGFRDRVIEKINSDNKSGVFKYIITVCSAAVIAFCFIITKSIVNKNIVENSIEDNLYASNGMENITDEVIDINNSLYKTIDVEETLPESTINSSAMMDNSKMALSVSKEYEDEIINMLKINKIETKRTNEGIRAKGKKEDIEVILYYFIEQIDIKQDGEYVIIKEK